MTEKKCQKCFVVKSSAEFSKSNSNKDGLQGYCKDCQREKYSQYYLLNRNRLLEYQKTRGRNDKLINRYGINEDDYEFLLIVQGSVCAICERSCDSKDRLSVDHDHRSGLVRGLLCDDCNNGLGRFKDNIELLLKAIAYLQSEPILYKEGAGSA